MTLQEIIQLRQREKGDNMEKKADLKTMTWKQRIGFVWDYYRLVILAVVAVIILIGMTVHHYMTTKEDVSQIVLVNAKSMPADEEPDFSEFMEQYGYDTAAQEVVVNDAYYVDLTSTDTSNLYSYQSLQTVIAGGGVDVLGADEMVFEKLCQHERSSDTYPLDIADLTQYFSKDELEQLKDYIFYVEDKDTGDTFAAGIRLGAGSWPVEHGYYDKECILGIALGSEHKEAAEQMFHYLLEKSNLD